MSDVPVTSNPTRTVSGMVDAATVLEAAPDAMLVTRSDGRIFFANSQAEKLFGYKREELVGQPVETLIPARFRRGHVGHRTGYFNTPRARPMGAGGLRLYGLRKDGTEFPAEISLSPLMTEEGPAAITAIRDVTERNKIEEERARRVQAEEAVRMRDEFLSIASHELKTPLAALQMRVDAMQRLMPKLNSDFASVPHLEQFSKKVEAIHAATERLGTLVSYLLDISRIATGRLELHLEPIDLVAFVREMATDYEDAALKANSPIVIEGDASVRGEWDSLRLEQIVSNLVGNAFKYAPGKPIEIGVHAVGDSRARLTVRDHGMGIAKEDQERIFERFERAVSSRNFGGFGLGLWIARQIIEAHGGSIRVESEPSRGSTFTVELPLHPKLVPPAKALA